ncbi:hypothetical protein Rs2_14810 [Raphanus sativus]|nr:hypothetical protein Rs2_14810 [Raphanus sativus]
MGTVMFSLFVLLFVSRPPTFGLECRMLKSIHRGYDLHSFRLRPTSHQKLRSFPRGPPHNPIESEEKHDAIYSSLSSDAEGKRRRKGYVGTVPTARRDSPLVEAPPEKQSRKFLVEKTG